MPDRPADASTLADFLRVAKRRKWIIIQATAIVPIVAVLMSLRQPDLYQSGAQVLLSRQNLAASFAGVPDVYATQDAQRYSATQAFLARSPLVAKAVVRSVKVPGLTARDFLASSNVAAAKDADLLTFSVVNASPQIAAELANVYAEEFTLYRRQLDTAAIARARKQIDDRMAELRRQGATQGQLYSTLDDREQQLATVEALQRENTYVARPAGGAAKIQPRPKRDAILGLGLGLALGFGLALLREALDTRLRSVEDIGERLGLPLLGRLPEPMRHLRLNDELVMQAEPQSVQAEAFRMLRTNFELLNLEQQARVILLTSAVEQEGKTTTIANLALALARAGRRVILVDLDLRRPALERFFALAPRPGVTDVAVGDAALDEALVSIPLAQVDRSYADGSRSSTASLHVLPAGYVPPDPGEFVGNGVIKLLIDSLRDRADYVLIDSPPLLQAVDAMALSTNVDAIVVAVRLSRSRRGMVSELKRVLDTSPTPKLGFILTGAESEESTSYDFGPYRQPYLYAAGSPDDKDESGLVA